MTVRASRTAVALAAFALLATVIFAIAAPAGDAPRAAARPTRRARPDPLDLSVGRSFFDKPWVAAPSSTSARDGLGPLFNAHSCSACHPRGAGARAPVQDGDAPVALVLRLGRRGGEGRGNGGGLEPTYGNQLQTRGIASALARVAAEGRLRIQLETIRLRLPDGQPFELQRPLPAVADLAYGPLDSSTCFSLRLAPSLAGAGLLDAVSEAAILAHADPDDRDGDGISGRARRVAEPDGGAARLGRFGHRAAQPSLRHQVAAAFRDDLGITSALFPEQPCTAGQPACLRAPSGAAAGTRAEIEDHLLDAVTAMTAHFAAPRAEPSSGSERGAALFAQVGCASCHVPAFEGARRDDRPPRAAAAYTDLLLHDLGPGLADDCDEPGASGSEWRTAPLWDLARGREGKRALLHDGRARSVTEAVLWHGGEAERARRTFTALDTADRAALVAFVASR